MNGKPRTTDLEDRIGYRFRNRALLHQALTHASLTAGRGGDNERLEFLGDRVLGLLMAEMLTELHPEASVGMLASGLNRLVSGACCAQVAGTIDLAGFLQLGKGLRGSNSSTMVGDAMEALLAAIFLDGGLESARDVVRRLWLPLSGQEMSGNSDPKSRLQIWAQAHGVNLPEYRILDRSGPDHSPRFVVEARLASGESSTADASSRRVAEMRAAEKLLTGLGDDGD